MPASKTGPFVIRRAVVHGRVVAIPSPPPKDQAGGDRAFADRDSRSVSAEATGGTIPGPAFASDSTDVLDNFLVGAPGGERAIRERAAIVEVGSWIRDLRAKRTTLEAVAEAAATTPATLSLLERGLGERGPTIGLVARILYALGLRLSFRRMVTAEAEVVTFVALPLGETMAEKAGRPGSPGAIEAFLSTAPGGDRALIERAAIRDIGRLLRELRGGDERSITRIADAAGTTASTLSLLERGLGERGPTIGLVARILHALGCQPKFGL
jgi:transcriptional regulator with XRE-family HTH domain